MKPLTPIEPNKSQRAIIQGFIAQVEKDLNDNDYSALDELMCCLLSKKENQLAIWNYLGDNITDAIVEQKLTFKY